MWSKNAFRKALDIVFGLLIINESSKALKNEIGCPKGMECRSNICPCLVDKLHDPQNVNRKIRRNSKINHNFIGTGLSRNHTLFLSISVMLPEKKSDSFHVTFVLRRNLHVILFIKLNINGSAAEFSLYHTQWCIWTYLLIYKLMVLLTCMNRLGTIKCDWQI